MTPATVNGTPTMTILKIVLGVFVILMGIVSTAFWRWADVVEKKSDLIIIKMDEFAVKQVELVVKVELLMNEFRQHEERFAHDGARQELNNLTNSVTRMSDRVEQLYRTSEKRDDIHMDRITKQQEAFTEHERRAHGLRGKPTAP